MYRPAGLVLVIVSALAVAGCAAAPGASPNSEPDGPSTSTIAVGPVVLSGEDAGVYYLSVVCQRNSANDALSAALVAGEQAFFTGGEPDLTDMKAAASESARVTRLSIEIWDDPYFVWPEAAAEQIVHIRSSSVADLSALNAIANATRFEDGLYAVYPVQTPEQSSAAQEIRVQLNLDTNTLTSCAGYETTLEKIHAEMETRNAHLAELATQGE